jgi:apolipoprotein N-acyltransferase
VTIALVQPGVQRNATTRADASLRLTAAFSRSGALHRDHPALIVWGESSVAFDLREDARLLGQIEALSAAGRADILVNQDSVQNATKAKVAVLVGPDGVVGEYVKTRLVPFGEYIPFRQQLSWLTSISKAATVNMVPGTGARNLRAAVPGGPPLSIGVLICFESAFPDMSRVDTDHGAQVIIYQTADSTFQGTWALGQHASLGALRAAETGRPVVQAALTGDSAAFDARGRQLSWLGQSRSGVVLARLDLPSAAARTPYDRLGDFVPWIALAIAVIFAAAGSLRSGHPGRLPRIFSGDKQRRAASVSQPEDSPRSGVLTGHNPDDSVS